MSPEIVELFTSLGASAGATAVLSLLLLRQLSQAAAERAEWLESMRKDQAETRETLNDLRAALVELRIALAERH